MEKYDKMGWYFRIDDDNKMSYKYTLSGSHKQLILRSVANMVKYQMTSLTHSQQYKQVFSLEIINHQRKFINGVFVK